MSYNNANNDDDTTFLLNCIYAGSYPSIYLTVKLSDILFNDYKYNPYQREQRAVVIGLLSPTGLIPGLLMLGGGVLTLIVKHSYYAAIQELQNYQLSCRVKTDLSNFNWLMSKGVHHLKSMHPQDFLQLSRQIIDRYQLNNKWTLGLFSSDTSKELLNMLQQQLDSTEFIKDHQILRQALVDYICDYDNNLGKKLYNIIQSLLQEYDVKIFSQLHDLDYPIKAIQLIESYVSDFNELDPDYLGCKESFESFELIEK